MDILQAALASGIRVVKFVPSYGDQPNDITHVTKCTFVARFFGGRCGAVSVAAVSVAWRAGGRQRLLPGGFRPAAAPKAVDRVGASHHKERRAGRPFKTGAPRRS